MRQIRLQKNQANSNTKPISRAANNNNGGGGGTTLVTLGGERWSSSTCISSIVVASHHGTRLHIHARQQHWYTW